ncbi:MAG: hypothetical protein IJ682_12305 [Lachnospiraceae bacterium]|nr:hypothetical protein [Lachnospiraceae bacterium]
MTLLITVFAAVIATAVWYRRDEDDMLLAVPMFLFWGASLMWLVDAVFEYHELRAAYFTPDPADMLNDAFLGLSVVAFALVIWIAMVLFKDPKGIVRRRLLQKRG